MTKWLTLTGACLALGFVVAGCGGDDDEEESAGGGEATQEQPAEKPGGSAGGGAAKTAAVSLKDISFQPADVTIAKGGTVNWTNEESVGHDVTKTGGAGKEFKSGAPGAMDNGDTFEQTFSAAGKIEYVCTVHPGMDGTVTVK